MPGTVELTGELDTTWPLADRGLLLTADTRRQKAESFFEAVSFGMGRTWGFIEQIYLNALSRRPTEAETKHIVDLVQKTPTSSRTVYGDLYWAMLNSSEFVLNH